MEGCGGKESVEFVDCGVIGGRVCEWLRVGVGICEWLGVRVRLGSWIWVWLSGWDGSEFE